MGASAEELRDGKTGTVGPSFHLSTSLGPVWTAAWLMDTYPLLDTDRPVMNLDLSALLNHGAICIEPTQPPAEQGLLEKTI